MQLFLQGTYTRLHEPRQIPLSPCAITLCSSNIIKLLKLFIFILRLIYNVPDKNQNQCWKIIASVAQWVSAKAQHINATVFHQVGYCKFKSSSSWLLLPPYVGRCFINLPMVVASASMMEMNWDGGFIYLLSTEEGLNLALSRWLHAKAIFCYEI